MRRKWIAILIGGAAAMLIIIRLNSDHKPELAKGPPLLFPSQQDWPTNVLTSISEFRDLSGKPRIDQAVEIQSFVRQYEMILKAGRASPHHTPVSKEDIHHILGQPDVAKHYVWGYMITSSGNSASWLLLYFAKNKLINMSGAVTDGYRNPVDERDAPKE